MNERPSHKPGTSVNWSYFYEGFLSIIQLAKQYSQQILTVPWSQCLYVVECVLNVCMYVCTHSIFYKLLEVRPPPVNDYG